MGVGLFEANAQEDLPVDASAAQPTPGPGEAPVPPPDPAPDRSTGDKVSLGDAPKTPDELGLVTPTTMASDEESLDDFELLSVQSGVPVDVIRQNQVGKQAFERALENLPEEVSDRIARVEVPDIVTGAEGTVQFVGAVPDIDIPNARIVGAALYTVPEQRELGERLVSTLQAAGVEVTFAAPTPLGAIIHIAEADPLSEAEVEAILRSELLEERAVFEVGRGDMSVVDATTSIGGSFLSGPNGTCTTGFAVGYPAGGSPQQKMSTAGHCGTTTQGQYFWDYNAIIGQWHLYVSTISTTGPIGELTIMDPVSQWQLDQWWPGQFQQADPEPFFVSNYNTSTQRPLNSATDPQVNDWTCYSGVSNPVRFCERIIGVGLFAGGTWGQAFTTAHIQVLNPGSSGSPATLNNTGLGVVHGFATLTEPMGGEPTGATVNVFTEHDYLWYLDNAVLCTTANNLCLYGAS